MIRSINLRAFVAMIACAAALPTFVRAADAPDLSTPKSTAVAFAKALSSGDKEGLRAVCSGTDEEMKAIDAMASLFNGMKKFREACDKKFGADNILSKSFPAAPDLAAEAEKAEFKEDGDTATSVPKPGEDPKDKAVLKKKDGKWKVDVASMGKDKLAEAAKYGKLGKVLEDFAGEVTAGKYKTAEEAALAMQPKVQDAMK